jgi:membrane-associated phospholipid phosphatase
MSTGAELHSWEIEDRALRERAVPSSEPSHAEQGIASPALRKYFWPLAFGMLGFAALCLDLPLAHWIGRKELPGDINKLCQLAEVFGHGFGAAAIFLAVWVLAPNVRHKLPRAIATAYAAGLAAIILKLIVARQRPHLAESMATADVAHTFTSWFPGLSVANGWQSFPSGHTALAAGLAIALAWLFPRGKWLFFSFAILAAAQRIASGNHFLSDVLWAAAIGSLVAIGCLPRGWLSPLANRLQKSVSQLSVRT